MSDLFSPRIPEHFIFSVEQTAKPTSQSLGEISLPAVADSPDETQSS